MLYTYGIKAALSLLAGIGVTTSAMLSNVFQCSVQIQSSLLWH